MNLPPYARPALFIANEWKQAMFTSPFQITNPYSGAVLATVQSAGPADYDLAVIQALSAQKQQTGTTALERSTWLIKWARILTEETENLARMITAESGKPLSESGLEVAYGIAYLHWFAAEALRSQGTQLPQVAPDKWLYTLKVPVGVVATITPWNFPFAMALRKWAPALAAGNAIVAKPATETPLTLLMAAGLYAKAALPPGLLNVLPTADYKEMGAWMCYDERVGKLSFTGSTQTGRLLMEQAAGRVKRLSLELGGNGPAIVMPSASVPEAVAAVMKAKFRNGGQSCVAVNRILIHESRYDDFARLFTEATLQLIQDDPMLPGTQLGTLIHGKAINRLKALVADALDRGAELLCGGGQKTPGRLQFCPTVLSRCTPEMDIWKEEIFGPVAALYSFRTSEEALAMANDSEHGLAGYLFTNNHKDISHFQQQMEVGILGINTGLISHAEVPFGGMKQSGFGKEGGSEGLAEYQVLRYVAQGF